MEVPVFSIFSAVSELFVTAIVLYAIIKNMKGGPLPWRMLGAVLIFELCVNIVYMANRAASAELAAGMSTTMKIFFAAHGILSLLMFAGLVVVVLLAMADQKMGRPTWFRRHVRLTWAFLFLWMVAVVSGEALFAIHYGPALFAG